MPNTVWVLTEYFADVEPETSVFDSAQAAWHELAERARGGGVPENHLDSADSDSVAARKMLDFWSESLSLHEEVVR